MLFDLRGRGRQRTVKGIYLLLAVLMGGGLVLFGIGGNTNGGLVDAITGNGSSSSQTGAKAYREDAAAAQRKIDANRGDEQAWLDLIRARTSLARTTKGYDETAQTYGAAGKADLREAVQAWQGYQATNPKDENLVGQGANLALRAYAGLGDEQGLVNTAEVLAETKNTAQAYALFADYAYRLGQTRKGELAGKKAIALAEPSEKAQVKASIDASKQAAPTATPEATPSATPSATATPKKKG
jgi:hypothetical protein